MEVQSRNLYLRVAGKKIKVHRQDRKVELRHISLSYDTSRYVKQRGLVSSPYTVLQTGRFSERYRRTLDE